MSEAHLCIVIQSDVASIHKVVDFHGIEIIPDDREQDHEYENERDVDQND